MYFFKTKKYLYIEKEKITIYKKHSYDYELH